MAAVAGSLSQTLEPLSPPPVGQPGAVCAADLSRAWTLLHRRGAPQLSWEQRLLVLGGYFSGRPGAWTVALEARVRALEAQTEALGKLPTDEAFRLAAEAPLQVSGDDFRFAPGACRW